MMRFVFYSVCRTRYFILARRVDKTNSMAFISLLDMRTSSCSTFFPVLFFFFFFAVDRCDSVSSPFLQSNQLIL